ncbi:MAG: 23S rRNA (pseudouridine(1915)-N(3))-methyltransferase RlmH [Gammaproteobacteria bacterium]
MKIHLITIGNRMPAWVDEATAEYLKRMPRECELVLHALPPSKRGKSRSSDQVKTEESKALRARIPKGALLVALDEHGKLWDTKQLSRKLDGWLGEGRDVALLIGGADGHASELLAEADLRWSLSPLTLPHGLARVMVAEQVYRAWSLLKGHPYHRE